MTEPNSSDYPPGRFEILFNVWPGNNISFYILAFLSLGWLKSPLAALLCVHASHLTSLPFTVFGFSVSWRLGFCLRFFSSGR
jgi:hypothetical protein